MAYYTKASWTTLIVLKMWILVQVKTYFGTFVGAKLAPCFGALYSKCIKEVIECLCLAHSVKTGEETTLLQL